MEVVRRYFRVFLTENDHTEVHLIVGMLGKKSILYKNSTMSPYQKRQDNAVVLDDNRMCHCRQQCRCDMSLIFSVCVMVPSR